MHCTRRGRSEQRTRWAGLRTALMAAALVLAGLDDAHARGLAQMPFAEIGQSAFEGNVVSLSLRIPLGGHANADSRGTLAMRLGSSWRDGDDRRGGGTRFVPMLEAGVTLLGDPVLRIGPLDMLTGSHPVVRAAEDDGRSDAGRIALIVLGSLALAGGVVYLTYARAQNDCNDKAAEGDVPCTIHIEW